MPQNPIGEESTMAHVMAWSGLHKIEIGLGTKFQDKFSAWFSRNFMLSGKAQNVHFILSNIHKKT